MDRTLKDFISALFASCGIPVHTVSLPCEDLNWIDQGLRRDILGDAGVTERGNALAVTLEHNTIYHYRDEFLLRYVSAITPDGRAAFIGPVLFEEMSAQRFEELFRKLALPDRAREPLRNYYRNVCYLPVEGVFDRLLDVVADAVYGPGNYRSVRGEAGSIDEWRELYAGPVNVPEKPFQSVRYIQERYATENALLSAVSSGAEDAALKHMTRLMDLGVPPRLDNELRDTKDLVIALNTLLRKTVEQAGVHPVQIDSRSNNNVVRVEQATSVHQCKALGRRIVQGYCEMVQEVGVRAKSLPIRTVISRVNADLTFDLSLKTLAQELNVSASYLSALFRRETGMSLTEYVNNCRVTQAKRLLLSSDLPIKDIALRCGLSDMYYFSRLFKRMTGTTPKAYRNMRKTYSFQELMGLSFAPAEDEARSDHTKS